jgi:hypothetical protein
VLGPGEIVVFDTTVTDWFGSIGSFAARTWFASDGESNVQDATSLAVWGGARVEHPSDLNRPQRLNCAELHRRDLREVYFHRSAHLPGLTGRYKVVYTR